MSKFYLLKKITSLITCHVKIKRKKEKLTGDNFEILMIFKVIFLNFLKMIFFLMARVIMILPIRKWNKKISALITNSDYVTMQQNTFQEDV